MCVRHVLTEDKNEPVARNLGRWNDQGPAGAGSCSSAHSTDLRAGAWQGMSPTNSGPGKGTQDALKIASVKGSLDLEDEGTQTPSPGLPPSSRKRRSTLVQMCSRTSGGGAWPARAHTPRRPGQVALCITRSGLRPFWACVSRSCSSLIECAPLFCPGER